MLGRLGVIGDVHCESETLERVLDALGTMRVDAVLCVGDLVDGAGNADATLGYAGDAGRAVRGWQPRTLVARRGATVARPRDAVDLRKVPCVHFESLPRVRHYPTPCGNALLCHGVGDDDEAWLKPDTRGYALQDIPTLRELMLDEEVQFMLGGHTHQRMVRGFAGLTVVNAGTIHRNVEQTLHAGGLRGDASGILLGYGGPNGNADRRARTPSAGPGRRRRLCRWPLPRLTPELREGRAATRSAGTRLETACAPTRIEAQVETTRTAIDPATSQGGNSRGVDCHSG